MKREYHVTVPIGAHAFLTVVADSEEDAVDRAMEEVTLEHVEDWDVMREVNRGNVCYFPSPWEIVVEEGDEVSE